MSDQPRLRIGELQPSQQQSARLTLRPATQTIPSGAPGQEEVTPMLAGARAPQQLVDTAMRDLPIIFASLHANQSGQRSSTAAYLFEGLAARGHLRMVVEHALMDAVKAGLVRCEKKDFQTERRAMQQAGWPWSDPAHLHLCGIAWANLPDDETTLYIATATLWAQWKPQEATATIEQVTPTASPVIPSARQKNCQQPRGGETKLIAALTTHHQFAKDSCLNTEPIGCKALARLAEVAPSTASVFFAEQFGGHDQYAVLCRDTQNLITAMKMLNGEFAPRILINSSAADHIEDDEDD